MLKEMVDQSLHFREGPTLVGLFGQVEGRRVAELVRAAADHDEVLGVAVEAVAEGDDGAGSVGAVPEDLAALAARAGRRARGRLEGAHTEPVQPRTQRLNGRWGRIEDGRPFHRGGALAGVAIRGLLTSARGAGADLRPHIAPSHLEPVEHCCRGSLRSHLPISIHSDVDRTILRCPHALFIVCARRPCYGIGRLVRCADRELSRSTALFHR
mmetsp:Transcript_139324/g.445488  ORF Transcript_139324/g.445488 Transcript_139324/m.445488 type:complete len:212 (-) Transcript_139324:3208-3843(-)